MRGFRAHPIRHGVWPGADGVMLAGDEWGPAEGATRDPACTAAGKRGTHGRTSARTLASAGYRAIAFDARGHGDSDWADDGRYSQDAMIEDLACLIRALGNPRPALVGASMGGGTSLVAVGEDHVDATALVMVDIAPHVEPEGVARIKAFMSRSRMASTRSRTSPTPLRATSRIARGRATSRALPKIVRIGDDGKYRWHWDPRFLERPTDVEKRRQRFEACASRLRLPVLLVRGGLSDVLTEEGAREFLALCPHAST